ncbi:MAG: helix-turn-helix domain-containing protein [Myxococcota bacterium]
MLDVKDADRGVRAPIVAELVRNAVAQGASPSALLGALTDLDPRALRVPYRQANAVWLAVANDRPAPHGLLLGATSTTTFGALFGATKRAQTGRDALRMLSTLMSYFTTDGSVSLRGDRLELVHRDDVERVGFPVEFTMALAVRLVAGRLGPDAVRQVSFRHRPLGPRRAYTPHLGPRLRFEAETTVVRFHREVLDGPRPGPDPLLSLQRRLEPGHLSAPPGSDGVDIEEAVKRAAGKGRFDLPGAARELGLAPRTLQRRAQKAGLELRALLRVARRDLALELLRDRQLSLRAVAERLDYADERSFSRAFEQWTGTTPSRWRRSRN